MTMKIIRNTYPAVIDTENLYTAVKRAAAGKRSRPDAAVFLLNQEENIEALHAELESMTYKPGGYRQFLIRDPKNRLVSAASFRDRVVHHAIHDLIEPIIDRSFIHDSYACRKGKGTHRAMDRAQHFLRSNDFVMHLDIRKYFESIDHAVLLSSLRKRIADGKARWLLESIIRSIGEDKKCGLPLGNITSQFFANLYLDELDRYIKHELKERCYLRYMDDMLLFSDSRQHLNQLRGLLQRFVKEKLKLEIHLGKSAVQPFYSGISFLGFRLFRYRRKVLPATVNRFNRRLKSLALAYRRGEIKLEKISKSIECWVSFMSHADTWHIRKEILGRCCF